jgi:hypothetical protein
MSWWITRSSCTAAKSRKMDNRLPTHLWVEAKIRECSGKNIPVYVLHRGNKTGGLVLVKSTDCKGQAKLYSQQRDLDGELGWYEQDLTESAADEYIRQERSFDTDLWVIEVEDAEMANPFTESCSL